MPPPDPEHDAAMFDRTVAPALMKDHIGMSASRQVPSMGSPWAPVQNLGYRSQPHPDRQMSAWFFSGSVIRHDRS